MSLLLKRERVPPHNGHPMPNEYDDVELSGCGESPDSSQHPRDLGTAGGLVLAWKDTSLISILGSDDFYILFTWFDSKTQRLWKVMAVYLDTNETRREVQFVSQ
ncbi:hypothetical protein PIB30_023269 [Stylosanthes scabra]|uniref:Uncharacterized protein n=1 Tax=Stylosanthes scabra TaxID=79078 RepID=A0ABU6Z665_9FABA|nr:hypothetical protein [Stylosanthes scabra]